MTGFDPGSIPSSSSVPPVFTPAPRSERKQLWLRSAIIMAVLVVALYVVEVIDQLGGNRLDDDGIVSREADGLPGVFFSPFLHHGFDHLTSNALIGAVLGFLLLLARRFLVTTAIVWAASGFGVWLFGPAHAVTIGASGIIFGWLAFLLVRGLFNRSWRQIGLGVLLFVVYGSVLWGLLPGQDGVSWQAHLFGAVGGVAAAAVLAGRDRRNATKTALQPVVPGFPPVAR